MARGNPAGVKVGAGLLYIAPLGSPEPTAVTGAWPSAWKALGYTEDGNDFTQTVTDVDLEVAEELEPIRTIVTHRISSVAFSLAQITALNLQVALNGGTAVPSTLSAGGSLIIEPIQLGTEIRVMLGWDSADGLERWIYRQSLNTAATVIPRKKGVKALIPVSFKLERPATGLTPYRALVDPSLVS